MHIQFLSFQMVFGLAAALLSILAFLPYIRDILRGKTKPQRATWTVWTVLAMISASANFASGTSQALGFVAIQAGATAVVAILALAYGVRERFTTLDLVVLSAAAFGLILWYATDVAAFALAISLSLSALGALPTVLKTYRNPGSETLSAWTLLLASSLLAVLSVGWGNWVMLAYPIYLVTLYSVITLANLAGRLRTTTRPLAIAGQFQDARHA